MSIDALNAANAYRNQLKLMKQAAEGGAQPEESAGASFSQLLENAVNDVVDAQKKSEALQMQSLSGKVELADLVTAVANAELTLNTVISIRDRVINAYNDIVKMPI